MHLSAVDIAVLVLALVHCAHLLGYVLLLAWMHDDGVLVSLLVPVVVAQCRLVSVWAAVLLFQHG